MSMRLISDFADRERMPLEYATEKYGGANDSPPLRWTGAPMQTKSFVITAVDHSPVAHRWVHWAVVDIPPEVAELPKGVSGRSSGRELVNTAGALAGAALSRRWGPVFTLTCSLCTPLTSNT